MRFKVKSSLKYYLKTFSVRRVVAFIAPLLVILGITLWLKFTFQNWVGLLLILSLGLLHGCNDLRIIKFYRPNNHSKLYFLYVLIAILAVTFFFYIPLAVLVIFGILSCYHFGEQHWINSRDIGNGRFYILSFCTGLSILSLIFCLNLLQTQDAIYALFEITVSKHVFYSLLSLSLLCTGLVFSQSNTITISKSEFLFEALRWATLLSIFFMGNLVISFATYFVFFHSIPSIQFQLAHTPDKTKNYPLISFLKNTWIVYLLSISGCLVVFWIYGANEISFGYFMMGFLIALASSHTILFHLFNVTQKQ